MRARGLSFCVGLLCASSLGCSTVTRLAAGPTMTPETSREAFAAGAGISANTGLGVTSEDGTRTTGLEIGMRGNFTGRSQIVAFGEGAYLTKNLGKRAVFLVDGGLHLAFERYDDRLLVGFGPYAGMGIGVDISSREYFSPGVILDENRRERTLLTFGPTLEVDARFSRPSASPFFGFQIGLAWLNEHLPHETTPRPPTPPQGPRGTPRPGEPEVSPAPPSPAKPPPPKDIQL